MHPTLAALCSSPFKLQNGPPQRSSVQRNIQDEIFSSARSAINAGRIIENSAWASTFIPENGPFQQSPLP